MPRLFDEIHDKIIHLRSGKSAIECNGAIRGGDDFAERGFAHDDFSDRLPSNSLCAATRAEIVSALTD